MDTFPARWTIEQLKDLVKHIVFACHSDPHSVDIDRVLVEYLDAVGRTDDE